RANQSLQEKLFRNDKIEFVWDSVVNSINGKTSLSSITVENVNSSEKNVINVDGVFVAVGIVPNSEAFSKIVKLDENGFIVAGEDCATSAKGIFAAGDVRTKTLRQVVTAVADGANAVNSVEKYLDSLS
ncbi:MAG: NAD(P)/FAD-dependent oxidoreductase, partial [Bacillota bacterium]|nr:NAD(P)/FAD-dependent oxidoreductase [Bacillota bacterium]